MEWINCTLQERIAAALECSGVSAHELLSACENMLGDEVIDKKAFLRLIEPSSKIQYSPYVSVIAEVTGVRAVWLQWGMGEIADTDSLQ